MVFFDYSADHRNAFFCLFFSFFGESSSVYPSSELGELAELDSLVSAVLPLQCSRQ